MQPKDIMLYYTAAFFIAALLIMRKNKRKGMLLKMRSDRESQASLASNKGPRTEEPKLKGAQPPERVKPMEMLERPLNVVFNYNGETWDAYEVLGLPAGSSMERVEQAHRESLQRSDPSSHAFMNAALGAIKTQWESYKVSKLS